MCRGKPLQKIIQGKGKIAERSGAHTAIGRQELDWCLDFSDSAHKPMTPFGFARVPGHSRTKNIAWIIHVSGMTGTVSDVSGDVRSQKTISAIGAGGDPAYARRC